MISLNENKENENEKEMFLQIISSIQFLNNEL